MGIQGNKSSFSLFSAPLLGRVHEGDCNFRIEEGIRENNIQARKLSHNEHLFFRGERKPVFKKFQCQRLFFFQKYRLYVDSLVSKSVRKGTYLNPFSVAVTAPKYIFIKNRSFFGLCNGSWEVQNNVSVSR